MSNIKVTPTLTEKERIKVTPLIEKEREPDLILWSIPSQTNTTEISPALGKVITQIGRKSTLYLNHYAKENHLMQCINELDYHKHLLIESKTKEGMISYKVLKHDTYNPYTRSSYRE
eukprot:TRINITY_DN647_c0_g1_i2.p1 TRINITY_DN647_c0_g1~~TRINITY_DN647_c0_g1_i2.p1  ORF type:complete len:117 (+),score=20.92 TRINITY_DN647_c0_g1_i2:116-466(+)